MSNIQYVHTSGINWESLAAISATVITGMSLAIAVIEKRSKRIRNEIKESIDQLAVLLTEKLETKQNVAELAARIRALEAINTLLIKKGG
jgi:hypothetical protein